MSSPVGAPEKILIPFSRPFVPANARAYIDEVLTSRKMSGDYQFTKRAQAVLEKVTGAKKALLTTSCTDALEMSGLLLDLAPGDEVILPSYTFVSTANAFALRGARPVFADIRPDTLNIDERGLERLITPKTKAIIPVHYAGVGCEMDEILRLAGRHNLSVVEDNAHGLFGKWRGKPLGSFGRMSTISFHETKNISCGEGGAILLNDQSLVDRAEILREKGTNRSRFFRGQVDKYTWVDLGSSFLMSDLLAAILVAQFDEAETIQKRREKIWQRYSENLGRWAASQGVRVPVIPEYAEQTFHMFYMLFPSLKLRTAYIEALKTKGIYAVFHYLPLHLSDMGRKFGGREGQCPVAEDLHNRIVRLPFYNDLSVDDQMRVIEATLEFRC